MSWDLFASEITINGHHHHVRVRVCVCVSGSRCDADFLGVLLPHAVLTPCVALYFPAAQSVQTEAPASEYLPATQAVQTSLVCSGKPKNLPAAQAVQTEAPAPEYLPERALPKARQERRQ